MINTQVRPNPTQTLGTRRPTLAALLQGTGPAVASSNCHESHQLGRWRERELEYLKQAAEVAVRQQGAEDVSLYSLTWSLYSKLYSLLTWTVGRFGTTNLISQRADQLSGDPLFAQFQNNLGNGHATIGVEGLSQRLRNYLNKGLSEDQLRKAVHNLAWAGHSSTKWFMIYTGLEEEADVAELIKLLESLHKEIGDITKERNRQTGEDRQPLKINLSFMLLIAHQHTPLQFAPTTSSYNLRSKLLMPLIDTVRRLNLGFRLSMTRDRIRVSQWLAFADRKDTRVLVEVGLRTGFVNFGPIPEAVTWMTRKLVQEHLGRDWMYYFRQKAWDHVCPADHIQTPQDRAHLWNAWKLYSKFIGLTYCLRSQVNLAPACSSCGSCTDATDRKEMLTRALEGPEQLQLAVQSRRDMTVRRRVRFQVQITDTLLRTVPKSVLARHLTSALMLSASEPPEKGGLGWDNAVVKNFLRVGGHNLTSAEVEGVLPWVGGTILIDLLFNKPIPDDVFRKLIPATNQRFRGAKVTGFVAGEKLVTLDTRCFNLLQVELNVPLYDLQVAIEKLAEASDVSYKEKVTIAKDVSRTVTVLRPKSDVTPLAFIQPTARPGYTRLTLLSTLNASPVNVISGILAKPPRFIRPNPITCLGVFKPVKPEENVDLFAVFSDSDTECQQTGDPIEIDVFTGNRYLSKSAPGLCLTADFTNLLSEAAPT